MEENFKIEYRKYIDEIGFELDKANREKGRLKLILRLYSLIGILISVVAILYFLISFFEYKLNSNQRLAIMTAGVGILLSIMSRLYSEIIKEREREIEIRKRQLEKISNFILNWATLERTIYSILDKYEPNVSRFSIKKNIKHLFDDNIISDREFINLERALDLRNKIVHGHIVSINDNLDEYSNQINEVIDKILTWSKARS